jgi:hypothetical protein
MNKPIRVSAHFDEIKNGIVTIDSVAKQNIYFPTVL